MKEQKTESEVDKKKPESDQQVIDREAQAGNTQQATGQENSGHLRTGEGRDARSGNNDTVGIP